MSHLSSTQSQKLRILSRLPVMRMGKVFKIVLGCLQAKKTTVEVANAANNVAASVVGSRTQEKF